MADKDKTEARDWRKYYELLPTSIEKFQFLCGLKELSWKDCQDAWFESQKIMPDIAKEYQAMSARVQKLEAALVSISKNSCCDTCQEAKLVALKALGGEE